MFNGIIFNKGIIKKVLKRKEGINIFLKTNLKFTNKDIGVSIACDGVCLTLISIKNKLYEFYLSKETIVRSNFKNIKNGSVINLELPLKYGHKISSLDIEGLVPSIGDAGVRLRYNKESINLTDILFYWGKRHIEAVSKVYPFFESKSYVTGSPVIDEMIIRRNNNKNNVKSNKNILVGTSCGYANHVNGMEFS